MNYIIHNKMKQFKVENKARNTWLTAEEWGTQLDMTITPQRLGSMCRAGLVKKWEGDKKYWGDNKNRYDVI